MSKSKFAMSSISVRVTIYPDGVVEVDGTKCFNHQQVADYIQRERDRLVSLESAVSGPRLLKPRVFESVESFLARGGQIEQYCTPKRVTKAQAARMTLEDLGL